MCLETLVTSAAACNTNIPHTQHTQHKANIIPMYHPIYFWHGILTAAAITFAVNDHGFWPT